MLTFIIHRTLLSLLTIWALSVISFVVIQLPPGDFVDTYILDLVQGGAQGAETTPAMLDLAAGLRLQFGLDKPIYVQYAKWMWRVLRGDLGQSLVFNQSVAEIITERLLMTIILAGTTAMFAWGLSIPIGIYSAVRQHSIEDYTFTFLGFMGLAVPDFLLALWLLWLSFFR